MGDLLEDNREKVFISIKCGMRWSTTGAYMGMDDIDFFQLTRRLGC